MNDLQPVSIEALIDVARDLTVQDRFDAAVVLRVLEHLGLSNLDVQAHGAVTHARLAAQSAQNSTSSSRDAIARFALARVVTLLETVVAKRSPAQLNVGMIEP